MEQPIGPKTSMPQAPNEMHDIHDDICFANQPILMSITPRHLMEAYEAVQDKIFSVASQQVIDVLLDQGSSQEAGEKYLHRMKHWNELKESLLELLAGVRTNYADIMTVEEEFHAEHSSDEEFGMPK